MPENNQTIRPVGIVMQPSEANEAEGVTIQRTIGSERLVLLDPFLLLDHLQVTLSGDATSLGFPRHPHRGIETLTYVISGRVHHKDSLGNDSSVGANGSQWMNAGGGIFHAEMLEAAAEGQTFIEALQLWFNLPASAKFLSPTYTGAPADTIPTVTTDSGATVHVVAGTFGDATGPFVGIAVKPTVLDVTLPAGTSVSLPAPAGQTTFAYLYRGNALFGEGDGQKSATTPQLVVFCDGESVQATAETDTRFLFVSAAPLHEPVMQYRSLVLNTVEQMREALDDLEKGTFTK